MTENFNEPLSGRVDCQTPDEKAPCSKHGTHVRVVCPDAGGRTLAQLLQDLPRIYIFANGWMAGPVMCAVSASGYGLGSHACSSEGWGFHDLGIALGSREDRHETYAKCYPEGYILELVYNPDTDTHEGLKAALELAEKNWLEEQSAKGTDEEASDA